VSRAVSIDDLGAWLLKASGDRSDIVARADRADHIGQWCVRTGYRTALMEAGQRVLLWVSGSRRGLVPGIWAVGALTGGPYGEPPVLQVPLALRWLPERVARADLRQDDRLTGLEVLRQPQAANPSYVTVAQLRAIEAHLTG